MPKYRVSITETYVKDIILEVEAPSEDAIYREWQEGTDLGWKMAEALIVESSNNSTITCTTSDIDWVEEI